MCVCVCVCMYVCIYLLSPVEATKGFVALVTVVATEEPKAGVVMVALLLPEGLRRLATAPFWKREPACVCVCVCVCVCMCV